MRLIVEVHAPTPALGVPVPEPEEFSQDLGDSTPPGKRHTVAPVGCDPAVIVVEGRFNSGSYSLLTIVQVTETANGSSLVLVVACDLHATHGVHKTKV